MSGSPVIQNGRIVGAVTHVLVNDPTRGYGIFIENMLNAAEKIYAGDFSCLRHIVAPIVLQQFCMSIS